MFQMLTHTPFSQARLAPQIVPFGAFVCWHTGVPVEQLVVPG